MVRVVVVVGVSVVMGLSPAVPEFLPNGVNLLAEGSVCLVDLLHLLLEDLSDVLFGSFSAFLGLFFGY
jgi:hypothetical protein